MLITNTTTAPLASSIEDIAANPSTKLVDSTTVEEPYCFFPVGTSFSEIDAKLGIFSEASKPDVSKPSDTELLERFLELKDSAVDHREKFQLLVATNTISDEASWAYSFEVNGKLLYETALLPINKQNVPIAVARYEAAYLRQIFSSFSVDFDTIHSAIEKFRESVSNLSSPKEKLDSFAQLVSLVPPGRCADMFLKVVKGDSKEKTWSYVFTVGTICLYTSDKIAQGDLNDKDNDYGYFKQLSMLQDFRVKMREGKCREEFMRLASDSTIPYGKKGLGTDIGIVHQIQLWAVLANLTGQAPSIVIENGKYTFALKGGNLFTEIIQPDSIERANVAISLIKTSSLPMQAGIKSIMGNLERYQYQPDESHRIMRRSGLPASSEATPMSLRAAVQDTNTRVHYLVAQNIYNSTTGKDSYMLVGLTNNQTVKIFSVSETAPPKVSGFRASISNLFYSSEAFKTEVLQLLLRPLKVEVYNPLALELDHLGLAHLQKEMHETELWEGMTFGQAFGVPNPMNVFVPGTPK